MRVAVGTLCLLLLAAVAGAQQEAPTAIVPDGSLGDPGRSEVQGVAIDDPPAFGGRDGAEFRIAPELGRTVGSNLFHSFERFDVSSRDVATFRPPAAGIDSVIARVTGGSPSSIRGTLRSEVPDADLFFLNPAGVVLGASATLDVPGSFFLSTADHVSLGAPALGNVFSASDPGASTLTGADPEAYGFLGPSAGALVIEGRLEVPRGQRLALIGGDLQVRGGERGFVSAPEGELALVATASAGSARLRERAGQLDIELEGFAELGRIELVDGAIVSSSGISPDDPPLDLSFEELLERWGRPVESPGPNSVALGELDAGRTLYFDFFPVELGAGRIEVRADELRIEDSDLRSFTPGDLPGGEIRIELDGDLLVRTTGAAGDGGFDVGILARAGGIPVTGSVLDFSTGEVVELPLEAVLPAAGRGGDVHISARDVRLEGDAVISSTTAGRGPGGSVTLDAREIEIADRASIFANAQGPLGTTGAAGSIELSADVLRLRDAAGIIAQTQGDGDAGRIGIVVDRLEVLDGAQIDNSTSAQLLAPEAAGTTAGAGGQIDVTATEVARIQGTRGGDAFARLSTFSQERSRGRAGRIAVRTPRLELLDGAGIAVTSSGAGEAGTIELRVDALLLDGGARVSSRSTGAAPGASGDAGGVSVRGYSGSLARTLDVFGGSSIAAAAPRADGGSVTLQASDRIHLRSSELTASVGDGTGGNITIDPRLLIVDRSRVVATATTGRGGNISITAGSYFPSGESRISADSELGIDGRVVINSPEVDLSGGLTALSEDFLAADALLRDRCALRDATEAGSFVIEERGRLPDLPDLPRPALHGSARGAAERTPESAAVSLEAGNAAFDAGRRDEARALWARAASDADDALNAALARLNLARSELDVGDVDAARERLARLGPDLARAPDEPGVRLARVALARARLRLPRETGGEARTRAGTAELLAEVAQGAEASGDALAAAWAWASLGELYLSADRADDALRLARRALLAGEHSGSDGPAPIAHWLLGRAHARRGDLDAALRAYRAAARGAAALRTAALVQGASPQALEGGIPVVEIALDLLGALLDRAATRERHEQRQPLLREALAWIERLGAVELQDYFRDACIAAQRRAVPEQVPGALAIYPLPLRDRLELIVGVEGGLERIRVDVPRARLEQTVARLRRLLVRPTTRQYRVPAAELYDWLIRPLEAHLQRARPEALVFVVRGALGSIPMSALWDREQASHLIERFPVSVQAGLSLVEPSPLRGSPQVLKAGLSVPVQGFPALASAAVEIRSIAELFDGPVLLDDRFRTGALVAALEQRPFGVVHIASHAQLGRDIDESFVLTFDGRLGLDRLARLARSTTLREQPLELLALSACETAAGTGRALLGLGGMTVRAGARAALASLWSVNDQATAELMKRLYAELARGDVSRARALQRAQLRLLEQPALGHPYFWSAFVLIGSWL